MSSNPAISAFINKIRLKGFMIILLTCFIPVKTRAQLITTVAGNGTGISSIDSLPSTCTSLFEPLSICTDPAANMYIITRNRLRKVEALTGIVTTLAGNGINSFSGDGGPATQATLQNPVSVTRDPDGNFFIAEKSGNRIRKIDIQTGIITTVAGTGVAGFGGDGGPATQALLYAPRGLATDASGNLFIADEMNNRVRKIDKGTGIITTIAGNGSISYNGDGGNAVSAGLGGPTQVVVDANNNIYISQCYGQFAFPYIRKINNQGVIQTIAGHGVNQSTGDNGPANLANLADPESICMGTDGNLYVAEFNASRVRRINTSTGVITVFAGISIWGSGGDGGPSQNAQLSNPVGLCADAFGNIYIADKTNHKIRKVFLTGPIPDQIQITTPTNSITANSTASCTGLVIFTSSVNNPGPQLHYQWYLNGVAAGTDSPVYSGNNFHSGDNIYCVITSLSCLGIITNTSNTISLSGLNVPTIQISADASIVCPGTQVLFSANATNAGNNPSYQWKVNGVNAGPNSSTWLRPVNINGENISCELTVDPAMSCVTTTMVNSNFVSVTVTVGVPASLQIMASDNPVCPGMPVQFSASVQNATIPPLFAWTLNGNPVGTNSNIFTINQLTNLDEIRCTITQYNSCITAPVVSAPIVMAIHSLPQIFVFPADTFVEPGSSVQLKALVNFSYQSFQWIPASAFLNAQSLTPVTTPINSDTNFIFRLITIEGCTIESKSKIKIERSLHMPNAFTPNGDGLNDVFRIPPGVRLDLVEFSVFDRWGKKIFSTKNITEGWDGKAHFSGSYPYLIIGFDHKRKFIMKGVVTLVK